ncbi:GNAT family acetyltransferase [Rhodoplanes azumiensis]|uniref:GNAT family acetyltransferase n=1 Tax=Rhodoplanes azumiensis TaxID=1897628 RepID=A0ABW5ADT5_9BRAD
MTPTIRSATAEDEDAVVALWRACGLVVSYNDPATDFRFARAGSASDILVGTVGSGRPDDRVVASVMVGHDGHRGWLWYVAVDPGSRGAGVGRAVVAAAEEWLRRRGVQKVHLLVRETNTGVVAFYEQQGFAVAPRVMMAKWLNGPP